MERSVSASSRTGFVDEEKHCFMSFSVGFESDCCDYRPLTLGGAGANLPRSLVSQIRGPYL